MPEQTQQPRLPTHEEVGALVKLYREICKWSQDQLAEIAGLNVRTIQRIERGAPSSFDTRRAIARAFEFEDIDVLNKQHSIPTGEELAAQQEKFAREHVTLEALPISTGRQLAQLVESASMDMSSPAFDLGQEAEQEFAALVDYFREYRDCADLYSEVQKLDVYELLQEYIDRLKALKVSLRYATRKLAVKASDDPAVKPTPFPTLYVVAFPLGEEPKTFCTPRAVKLW